MVPSNKVGHLGLGCITAYYTTSTIYTVAVNIMFLFQTCSVSFTPELLGVIYSRNFCFCVKTLGFCFFGICETGFGVPFGQQCFDFGTLLWRPVFPSLRMKL